MMAGVNTEPAYQSAELSRHAALPHGPFGAKNCFLRKKTKIQFAT
jgi:hypothetical protein